MSGQDWGHLKSWHSQRLQLQNKIQSMYDWAPVPLCSEILRVSGPMARKDSFLGKASQVLEEVIGRHSRCKREGSFLNPVYSLHDPGVHWGLLSGRLRRGRRWRFAGQWRWLLLGNRSMKKLSCYWYPQRSTNFCCLFIFLGVLLGIAVGS